MRLVQLLWVGPDGKGNFRNDEQKAAATPGPLPFGGTTDLLQIIQAVKPSCLVGAVGRDPGCFNQVGQWSFQRASNERHRSFANFCSPVRQLRALPLASTAGDHQGAR